MVKHDWRSYAFTALTVAIVLKSTLNPLWLIEAGALFGMVGLV